MKERNKLDKMDKVFKVIFMIAFIVQIIIAFVVTGNSSTPLTGAEVASVGVVTVLLLVIATVIYGQFPDSVLGKPRKIRER